MITIDPNSKDTEISQIINQWAEITELKAQWQRVSNNTWLLEDWLDLMQCEGKDTDYYYDCINALVTLSQCLPSKERTDIEETILIDLMTLVFTPETI